jgi:hypothetical protein
MQFLCGFVYLFFGSLLKHNDLGNIVVTAVNLDDGLVGASLLAATNQSLEEPGPHLRWRLTWVRSLTMGESVQGYIYLCSLY